MLCCSARLLLGFRSWLVIAQRWMIQVKTGTLLYFIDQWLANINRNCRTTPAAADITLAFGILVADIICTMQNNTTTKRMVIDAFLGADQFQGISVAAFVGFAGNVHSKAAFVRR